jgi:hypothetical protein
MNLEVIEPNLVAPSSFWAFFAIETLRSHVRVDVASSSESITNYHDGVIDHECDTRDSVLLRPLLVVAM